MLFRPDARFQGLPKEAFDVFAIRDRESRRRAILEVIHPPLESMAEDLLGELNPRAVLPLHPHLPRLDWPRGYQPFCTWLTLSRETQGYQAGPQLSLGVHADRVTVRLGWDTSADAFGRFEFLCRHGEIGRRLVHVAGELELHFRVFAAAAWPQGSELVFESADDPSASFEIVRQRGVWWEVGRQYDLPRTLAFVCSPDLGRDARKILVELLPIYERFLD